MKKYFYWFLISLPAWGGPLGCVEVVAKAKSEKVEKHGSK